MRCEEAGEFVSALHDGEMIPRDAAEHVGRCETCRAQLAEYAQIGAELRCTASLTPVVEAKTGDWTNSKHVVRGWWQKGWETMRIPRLVFALLTVLIVVLGSSLVMVKARARDQGAFLMMTATPTSSASFSCALSLTNEKQGSCGATAVGGRSYMFRVVSTEGDRIQLGIRGGVIAGTKNPDGSETYYTKGFDKMEERTYWFVPGQKLDVAVPNWGDFEITGYLTDHQPALIGRNPEETLDPKADEIRFVFPVLLRGNDVLVDLDSSTDIARDRDHCIAVYVPGEGLFEISLSPQQRAVEGRVTLSRISFQMDGQSYAFLLAAPVTRGERVWVLKDGEYKPKGSPESLAFMGTPKLGQEP